MGSDGKQLNATGSKLISRKESTDMVGTPRRLMKSLLYGGLAYHSSAFVALLAQCDISLTSYILALTVVKHKYTLSDGTKQGFTLLIDFDLCSTRCKCVEGQSDGR